MSDQQPVRIALVGLGFGAEFIPIYQAHPDAKPSAICQRNRKNLDAVGDAFGIEKRYTDYADLLKDPNIDAVHINTPIPLHAEQSIQALEAGKHVACTVPMATSVEDCKRIVDAQVASGKRYMMMETVVYSREFLFMKDLYENGELGRIQFLQASHQQDMDGWPDYWPGLPPMHYATHCAGPVLALPRRDATRISCFGSGRIGEDLAAIHGSPWAIESAHIQLEGDLSARIYRSLFDTARQYRESIDVYGSKKTVEWPLIEGDPLVVHTAKKSEFEIPENVECPDYAHLLPKEIQRFTTQGVYDTDASRHLSFTQGAGHGGSHPHLAHEFVDAILNNRDCYPNARESANWTCVGILAHESAMKGGEIMDMPTFTLSQADET
ncbi:MAG: Gfo/Idh/MocA family oxidoreductase [Planctomycetes bacterium]|nr:Gfo/Idh/MocA family oxidoreductase [Planctomycetota bacterium]